MMEWIFFKVFDMSAAASCCIAVVLVLRLCLRKMPKLFSYMLWMIVLVRLLCPVMAESRFGLLPSAGQQDGFFRELGDAVRSQMLKGHAHMAEGYGQPGEMAEAGMYVPDGEAVLSAGPAENGLHGETGYTPSGAQGDFFEKGRKEQKNAWATTAGLLWFGGLCAILLYSAVSVALLKRRLSPAEPDEEGIFESDRVEAPFLFGILRPRIYFPPGIEEPERSYIIAHEKIHIRRGDCLVKPLFFAAAAIHWFNPFVWIAWRLMCRDMEMCCDEAVLNQLGETEKKNYSKALLRLSVGSRVFAGGPPAFGENDTKQRVRNIGAYKKPVLWAAVPAFLLCLAAAALLLTNRQDLAAGEEITAAETDNQRLRDLARGEELTFEKLLELAVLEMPTLKDYAGYDGAEWSERTGDPASIREDLVYYLTDEETGRRYRLYIPYFIENNAVELVNLIKDDGSALLLYSSYDGGGRKSGADILSFRQHTEELSDWVNSYTVPKAEFVEKGAYSPEGGYGYGGVEFTWAGPEPYTTNGSEDFGDSIWKTAAGIFRYPVKSRIHIPDAAEQDTFIFENGELTKVSFRGLNHTAEKGVTEKLAGCEESAVIFCLNHDLYTVSELSEAEQRGQVIPEDEQTVDIWYAAIAREGASYGYIVYLNSRYYSKEETEEFAKSLRFTEQAWE